MNEAQMFESIRLLVQKLAHDYAPQKSDYDDFFSIGSEAALRAIRHFDTNRGTKLVTLVHRYVRNALVSELRRMKVRKCVELTDTMGVSPAATDDRSEYGYDAKALIALLIGDDTTVEALLGADMVKLRRNWTGLSPAKLRSAARKALGRVWTRKRVADAFDEVKAGLKN